MSESVGVGDIVRFSSSTNPELDGDFIVKYLDDGRITVVEPNGRSTTLDIDAMNGLAEYGVEDVSILSKASDPSFSGQHGLLPGVEITIELENGDTLDALIEERDEDKISLKLDSGDLVHIDFGYAGIDPESGISRIQLRGDIDKASVEAKDEEDAPTEQESQQLETFPSVTLSSTNEVDKEEKVAQTEIQFGEELPPVSMLVEVPEEEKRYGIATQELELLNELLAVIPTGQRNVTAMAKVNKMVESYGRLRKSYSTYDEMGTVSGFATADQQPLIALLENQDKNMGWIWPLVSQVKKVYLKFDDKSEALDFADVEEESQLQMLKDAESITGRDASDPLQQRMTMLADLWTPAFAPPELVYKRTAGTELRTIVSNFPEEEEELSTVFSHKNLTFYRFLQATYLPPETLLGSTRLPSGGKKIIPFDAVKGQSLNLEGYMTMPKPIITWTSGTTLGTSILKKCNYALLPVMLDEFLKPDTKVKAKGGKKIGLSKNSIASFLVHPHQARKMAYDDFLAQTVPTSTTLIEQFDFTKFSLAACIDELPQLGITRENIDAGGADEINKHVAKVVRNWTDEIITNTKQELSEADRCRGENVRPLLVTGLSPAVSSELSQLYGERFSMQDAIRIDSGQAVYTKLALDSSHLQTPELAQEPNALKQCGLGVHAKTYADVTAMQAEQESPPRFDAELDPTYYDNKQLYKAQIGDLADDPSKLESLKAALQENTGMDDRTAEQEANALVLGYRSVAEGDYALIAGSDDRYVWTGTEWRIKDADDVSNVDLKDCIVSDSCLVFNNNCVEKSGAASAIAADLVKSYAPEYYERTAARANENYELAVARLPILKQQRERIASARTQLLKTIAEGAVPPLGTVSPSASLLSRILEQGDFALRMLNLTRFAENLTRGAINEESPYWRYCNSTSVKLVPTFLINLAETYTNGGDYEVALMTIVSAQGQLAGDGEAIIDKHTGWEITTISLSTDEGFDDAGFAIKTRELMKTVSKTSEVSDFAPTSPTMVSALAVVRALGELTSAPITENVSLIMNEISMLLDRTLPSREEFARAISKSKKKETYENTVDQIVVLYSSAYFLLFTQTSPKIPRARRVFPGCERTFAGYPRGPSSDVRGIDFISCVLASLRTNERPWGGIRKVKPKTLAKKLKKVIENYIIDSPVATSRIADSIASARESVGQQIDAGSWDAFLPPVFTTRTTLLPDLGDIRSNVTRLMKVGRPIDSGLLNTPMKMASFAIGVEMRRAMEANLIRDQFILTTNAGVPYLENACCATASPSSTAFFLASAPDIPKFNAYARSVAALQQSIVNRSRAPIIVDSSDTRIVYPQLPEVIGKPTIALAFIVYCEGDMALYDIPELFSACTAIAQNPLITKEQAVMSLSDTAIGLDTERLDALMAYINSKRIVEIDVQARADTRPEDLGAFIEKLPIVDEKRRKLVDAVSTGTIEDALETATNENLDVFIRETKSSVTPEEYNKVEACLNSLFPRTQLGDDEIKMDKWETLYDSIRMYAAVLPNMIINAPRTIAFPVAPKHWGLSDVHEKDVVRMVKSEYLPLEGLYLETSPDDLASRLKEAFTKAIDQNLRLEELAYLIAPSRADSTLTGALLKFILSQVMVNTIRSAPSERVKAPDDRPRNALVPSEDGELVIGLRSQTDMEIVKRATAFLQIICETQSIVDTDYETVAQKAVRTREKEKDMIVEYLTQMSDEAREIENAFKKHSLGKWSVGMQKGFKKYEKDTYDAEREAMDERAFIEQRGDGQDVVTGMLGEVYPGLLPDELINLEMQEGLKEYAGEDENISDESFGSEI